MNIIKQKNNNLLNREEIVLEITKDSIPSKLNLKKEISEKLKKPEENIVIEKVNSQFGNKKFIITAKVYNDSKSKEKYETITRKQRKKILEDSKKQAEEAKKAKETAKNEEESK